MMTNMNKHLGMHITAAVKMMRSPITDNRSSQLRYTKYYFNLLTTKYNQKQRSEQEHLFRFAKFFIDQHYEHLFLKPYYSLGKN